MAAKYGKEELSLGTDNYYAICFRNYTSLPMDEITLLFSRFGDVGPVRSSKDWVFVRYRNKEHAEKAIADEEISAAVGDDVKAARISKPELRADHEGETVPKEGFKKNGPKKERNGATQENKPSDLENLNHLSNNRATQNNGPFKFNPGFQRGFSYKSKQTRSIYPAESFPNPSEDTGFENFNGCIPRPHSRPQINKRGGYSTGRGSYNNQAAGFDTLNQLPSFKTGVDYLQYKYSSGRGALHAVQSRMKPSGFVHANDGRSVKNTINPYAAEDIEYFLEDDIPHLTPVVPEFSDPPTKREALYTIIVANFPIHLSPNDLWILIGEKDVGAIRMKKTPHNQPYCHVYVNSYERRKELLDMNGTMFCGNILIVNDADDYIAHGVMQRINQVN